MFTGERSPWIQHRLQHSHIETHLESNTTHAETLIRYLECFFQIIIHLLSLALRKTTFSLSLVGNYVLYRIPAVLHRQVCSNGLLSPGQV